MFKRIKNNLHFLYYKYLVKTNPLIKKQRKNPLSIPIIIINFNQLFYLQKLVDFLLKRGFENIVIIDNKSTYLPLLEYYNDIKTKVRIKKMDKNYGHSILYLAAHDIKEFTKGYYVITDPDILPNENLPINFMDVLIEKLEKYFNSVTKVGFALKIDDIPDFFPLKQQVVNWENKFWENEVEENVFLNVLDTTFALYKPRYPYNFYNLPFLPALRIGSNYTATHGGWYKNPKKMTEEEIYYQRTAKSSSSWNFDKDNQNTGKIKYD
ncbi:hypothetical protein AS589_00675 [Empedobacter brevis]|uniref:Glycosyltransferase 2-like domain-containing protein n=2 Tax=Empedobacter brevis TaxID=247 RepID=A0A511NHV1_9FLAO|nr:hypothetical protein [Empedobacter brevis]QHC83416.1 hypothetical protein AS589_00675 [Empedobacter brevis]GEM52385.1 hypothetical protein EB1_21750 [Empedobacter brevis NBRC 14943 = ATCC 43319]